MQGRYYFNSDQKRCVKVANQFIEELKNIVINAWDDTTPIKKLGSGAYGVVFECEKRTDATSLVTKEAVKVIKIPRDYESDFDDDFAGTREEYYTKIKDDAVKEIETMVNLKSPHIVHINEYKIVEQKDQFGWYILIKMDLLQNLKDAIKIHANDSKELAEARALKLCRDMCDALEVCFNRGYVHRDIKPENIFVSDKGEYYLGDFGLAKQLSEQTKNVSSRGTETYIAPEAFTAGCNQLTDLYSLGLVLYKMVNKGLDVFQRPGDNALRKDEAQLIRLNGKEPIQLPANCSEQFGAIVCKMCAYAPEDRYQSVYEIRNALESIRPKRVEPTYNVKSEDVKVNNNPDMSKATSSKADRKTGDARKRSWRKIKGFITIVVVLFVINGIRSCTSDVFAESDKNEISSFVSTYLNEINFFKILKTVKVESIKKAEMTVDKIVQEAKTGEAVNFIAKKGRLSSDGQEDVYEFTPSVEGTYRFDLTGIVASSAVSLKILDELDECIENEVLYNDEGITVYDLIPGKTYRVLVSQYKGYCDYKLTIGQQKPEIDISGYTSIKDSVEFIEQTIIYYYTIPVDGTLRVQIDDLFGAAKVKLMIWDSLEHNLVDEYCVTGEGVTLTELVAGDVYKICVKQVRDFSSYKLSVFEAKPTVDISDYTVVNDSIEFSDQRNVYTLIPKVSGAYRFGFDNIQSGTRVCLKIFDSNYLVLETAYCNNGEGATIEGFEEGKKYEVQVVQDSSFGNYTLEIGAPKPTIELGRKTKVKDSIQYVDQCNTYTMNAKAKKMYTITLSDLQASQNVLIAAYDELGYELGRVLASRGDSFTIDALEKKQTIKIKVYQVDGTGDYSFSVTQQ